MLCLKKMCQKECKEGNKITLHNSVGQSVAARSTSCECQSNSVTDSQVNGGLVSNSSHAVSNIMKPHTHNLSGRHVSVYVCTNTCHRYTETETFT